MQSKNVKQSRIHRLFGIKVKSKLAAAYMDTAVKILIYVVCGALFLTGIYGVIQKVVLPKTESSVTSMFAYEAADAGNGGGAGGSGGVEAPDVNEEYEMLEGKDTIAHSKTYTDLVFRSDADYSTFKEVRVNGEVIDSSNYKVTEGSTVVTLYADYIASLGDGDHDVQIISENHIPAKASLSMSSVIPEGATYKAKDGNVYEAGEEFPTPVQLDEYYYGDYYYRYFTSSGWQAKVIDKTKKTYEPMLTMINGSSKININNTFLNCTNLETAPSLPSTATMMNGTFEGCTSLKKAPAIPSGIIQMSMTFRNCTSLKEAPVLLNLRSSSTMITSMSNCFEGCTSLEVAPLLSNVPDGMSTDYVFAGCSALKTYVGSSDADGDFSNYILPNTKTINSMFKDCTSIKKAPAIPSSVTNMNYAFEGCTSLEVAPTIPNSVTALTYTFSGCTSLKEAPHIPNNITYLYRTFSGCTSLEVAPTIPNSVTTLEGAFYNCTSLKTAPAIPSSVTNISYAFSCCTSLTGTIEINANIKHNSYCERCFVGVDFAAQNLTLTGTSTKLALIGATGTNYQG